MQYGTNMRQERGQIIAQARQAVRRINKVTYRVKSQTHGKFYRIKATNIGWKCECPDHVYHGVKCKHIFAVEFSYAIRETVRQEVAIQQIIANSYPLCRSSKLVKHGIRHNNMVTYKDIVAKIAVSGLQLILDSKRCMLLRRS